MRKRICIELMGPKPTCFKGSAEDKSESLNSQGNTQHWNDSERSNSKKVQHGVEEHKKKEETAW